MIINSSGEKSFSKFKFIKNRVPVINDKRKAQSLNVLVLHSIESDIL